MLWGLILSQTRKCRPWEMFSHAQSGPGSLKPHQPSAFSHLQCFSQMNGFISDRFFSLLWFQLIFSFSFESGMTSPFLSIHRNNISLKSEVYILPCLGSSSNLIGWLINVAQPVILGSSFVFVSSPTRLHILRRKDSGTPQMTHPWHP